MHIVGHRVTDRSLRLVQSVQQTAEILNALTYLTPSFISPFNTSTSTIHLSHPFQALSAQGQGTATSTSLTRTNANTLSIRVPTGALEHIALVQPVTLLAMGLCAAYVAYMAILVATSRDVPSATRSLQGHENRKRE